MGKLRKQRREKRLGVQGLGESSYATAGNINQELRSYPTSNEDSVMTVEPGARHTQDCVSRRSSRGLAG